MLLRISSALFSSALRYVANLGLGPDFIVNTLFLFLIGSTFECRRPGLSRVRGYDADPTPKVAKPGKGVCVSAADANFKCSADLQYSWRKPPKSNRAEFTELYVKQPSGCHAGFQAGTS